ncbi:hypothetical protein CANINC_003505 [Pichia inconspicua]|uniref:Uncharacterized protein n=1 Tax=Pichia inconspicua TaxID=52247 RepID=A0A4T0WZV4_9ASCO|nr:hypothetical protein CANINC_003505 [[Candida] inconspicua]
MLRRDPTTIKLTAEDLRDNALTDHAVLTAALHSQKIQEGDVDDQNWDSSIDESYLGTRGACASVGIGIDIRATGVEGVTTNNNLSSK